MKRSLSRLVVGGLFCILSFQVGFFAFAASSPVLCCKCSAPGDSSDICLTGSADTCANLLSNSKNPNIAGFSCPTTLEAANCRTVADGGVCTTAGSVATYSKPIQLPPPASQPPLLTPKPGVAIPGLTFSSIAQVTGGKIAIPFIAQYIAAMYNYLIGATLIVAALMLVYGGFLYVLGATVGDIRRSKEIIFNSLVGLILVFSAFTLLKTVSPPAASLKPLDVMVVKRDPLEDVLARIGTTTLEASATPGSSNSQPLGTSGDTPVSTDRVNISGIQYDSSASACENINKYCSTRADVASAATYEQKQKLLAKAVLGFNAVCLGKSRCVYSQASSSNMSSCTMGKGAPKANFSGPALQVRAGLSPENIWPNNPECVEAYNKDKDHNAVVGMDQCNSIAAALYNEKINQKIGDIGFYGSDCVMWVMNLYNCASPGKWVGWGTNKSYMSAVTALVSKRKIPQEFLDAPQLILFTNVGDPDIESKVAQKGGVKFGDVFANLTPSLHFYLYTGGRADVPFTFIEMGGTPPGADIPGLGHFGGPGIKTMGWRELIKSRAAKNKDYKIMIWRPFADASSNAPLTTPEPAPAP